MKRLAGSTWAILIGAPIAVVLLHVVAFFLMAATIQNHGRGDPAAEVYIKTVLAPSILIHRDEGNDAGFVLRLCAGFVGWSLLGICLCCAIRAVLRRIGSPTADSA